VKSCSNDALSRTSGGVQDGRDEDSDMGDAAAGKPYKARVENRIS